MSLRLATGGRAPGVPAALLLFAEGERKGVHSIDGSHGSECQHPIGIVDVTEVPAVRCVSGASEDLLALAPCRNSQQRRDDLQMGKRCQKTKSGVLTLFQKKAADRDDESCRFIMMIMNIIINYYHKPNASHHLDHQPEEAADGDDNRCV